MSRSPKPMKVRTISRRRYVSLADAERYASERVDQALNEVVAATMKLQYELDNAAFLAQHTQPAREAKRR